jgi:hypothetical protein
MKMQANNKWESTVSQEKWSLFTEKFSTLQLRQESLGKKVEGLGNSYINSDSCRH